MSLLEPRHADTQQVCHPLHHVTEGLAVLEPKLDVVKLRTRFHQLGRHPLLHLAVDLIIINVWIPVIALEYFALQLQMPICRARVQHQVCQPLAVFDRHVHCD